MKVDIVLLVFLTAARMTLSLSTGRVFTLIDKFNLRYEHQNRTVANEVNETGRNLVNEQHNRRARCLDLFDWLFDYLEPETTSFTTTTTGNAVTSTVTTTAVGNGGGSTISSVTTSPSAATTTTTSTEMP
ncbi:uncharacterized protein LOC110827307 [Zootermopsis nevadensis]|uniref:Uncharacterized protein n=1 Tax=Zootermopsis nevadensis TaxID=136037 RepID=A0A067RDY4_ZOONE|nr:uncharacterized protein LOC110827307 [Zootermopsis nevadensis]KDR22071.1 hypothetical protein L798_02925 [Zootermopsis nevadensis]